MSADAAPRPTGQLDRPARRPRRRSGRARGRDDARRLDVGGGRAQAAARGDLRGRHRPRARAPTARSRSPRSRSPRCSRSTALLRLPIIRGVVALVESLVIGFKALGISANAQLPEEEKEISGGMWFGTVVVALAARRRPVLRRPGRADEPHQGPARLVVPLLARRGHRAHGDLPRLPAAALAPARPAPRLRVPRRRAQDDLLLRGGPRAHARERAALQPPAPALRDELPAHRDDRRDLRLRADRPARLVLARADAHRRRAADRRHLVRDHQVRRAQPPPALGARGHVARACSCRSSRRASPTSTSSPSRSPPWRRCSRSRTRATSPTSDTDRHGGRARDRVARRADRGALRRARRAR